MSDHIPLSWLRQEWKQAQANWAYNGVDAYDLWRAAIRDEQNRRTIVALRERIATLEAEQWEVVPDGFYHGKTARSDDFEVEGAWLRTYSRGAVGWGCRIPTAELGWRLCRRKASEGEVTNGE